jgi:8-oxo-dGTP pyrophosphatase MutT (NUDIX family)
VAETVLATGVARWIPVAHTMKVVRSDEAPPSHLTTAAFVFVRERDGKVLLTHVNEAGRSWDVPGGHIDQGESTTLSAIREVAEETGFALEAASLWIFGWQEFLLSEVPPAWYKYPYPLSYCVYFTASTNLSVPPLMPDPNSECGPAEWCTPSEVLRRCPSTSWLPLLAVLTPAKLAPPDTTSGLVPRP